MFTHVETLDSKDHPCLTLPFTGGSRALWAPDISFHNGQYYLYYAASTFGSQRSATAPSVELAAPHHRCGVERADVKIGIDEAAAAVDLATPRETTIAALGGKPKPPHVTNHMPRDSDTERTVFVLRDVHLTLYKEEGGANGDHDFHLVVKDTEHRSMVAEIPEAECMLSSPWRRYVGEARATVDGRLHPTGAFQPEHDHVVSVVGVGFFDRIHGQKGHASNGIELHPVLDICFGVGCRLGRAW